MRSDRDHTGRTVALLGGAALVAWLLLRSTSGGLRGPEGKRGTKADRGTGRASVPARCVVWVRADRIEVDGTTADLPTVIARCRAAGEAEVHATGNALTRVVRDVLAALRSAGVTLYTSPDLSRLVPPGALP